MLNQQNEKSIAELLELVTLYVSSQYPDANTDANTDAKISEKIVLYLFECLEFDVNIPLNLLPNGDKVYQAGDLLAELANVLGRICIHFQE